jgi:hypothetical protein
VDPLAPDYPWYTPYQYAGNTPIQAIDLDGLEPLSRINPIVVETKFKGMEIIQMRPMPTSIGRGHLILIVQAPILGKELLRIVSLQINSNASFRTICPVDLLIIMHMEMVQNIN